MVSVKHKFTTGKGDGPDSTRVRPTNWNDDHNVTTTGDGVVLGRPVGAGPGDIQEVPMANVFPAGVMMPFAGGTPPAGWLLCYGQSLLRADYPNLYLAIGTTYGPGAVPGSTFAAPDARGVTLVGKTNMGGADRGNLSGGATLGAYLGAQSQGPIGVNVGQWFGGGGYSAGGYTTGAQSVDVSGMTSTEGGGLGTVGGGPAIGTHNHSFNGHFNTNGEALNVVINSFGASGGTGTFGIVQPSLAVNMIIKT